MVEAAKLLGRYRLQDRIARGGMGSVYEATDELLGRRVAIKLLKDSLADDQRFVERFRREARAVAGLSHPNIANVFDYGEDEDSHFIVMELAEGRDLSRLLEDEGRLEPTRAAHISEQTLRALGHAHSVGIVHRDVKPANIIVADTGSVKVTDFGIARAAGESTLTATGSVIGTANYISPEQASGRPALPASDIYSMGIVLYEMLTGGAPFPGDTPIAIAMRHVSDPVPAPSSAAPGLPRDFDRVVDKATRKEPKDRYAHADDMADDITAVAGHAPGPSAAGVAGAVASSAPTKAMTQAGGTRVLTEPSWPPAPDTGRSGTSPMRAGLIALVVLALAAGLLLLFRLVNAPDESTARDKRPQEKQQTSAQPAPATLTIPSDIVGQDAAAVEAELKGLGFTVKKENDDESSLEVGFVSGSNPAPGTSGLEEGDEVTLYVSTGETAEEASPQPTDETSEEPGKSEEKGKSKEKGKGNND